MKSSGALVLTAALTLAAATAFAQEAPAPASPFAVHLVSGLEAARPGDTLPVAVVFDTSPHHKVYEESVSIALAPHAGSSRIVKETRPPARKKFDKATGEVTSVYEGRAVFALDVELPAEGSSADSVALPITVAFRGCSLDTCFMPEMRELTLSVPARREDAAPVRVNEDLFAPPSVAATPDSGTGDEADRGLIVHVLLAFLGGLMLSFTPCVYPLIPITAAVIGAKGGGWRKGLTLSLVYVLGLSITYSVLGAAVAKAGGAFGSLSTHWAVLSMIGVVFVAFAWSLFDVYELEVPQSLQAKLRLKRAGAGPHLSRRAQAAGGPAGVFLMGLLSGLVAGPCVAGPILTVLLTISRTGDAILGAAMLFALAWGMSVFLILTGTFSGMTSKLPKAGAWMLAVKTGLGVVVLLASLYFLRPVLPLWAFTAWVAVPLVALGIWRGALVKNDFIASRARKALRAAGLTALVLGLYLGVGALVRIGMPAPLIGYIYPDAVVPSASLVEFRTDYDAALADARASGRPAMIDFVIDDCVGCRELEEHVFSREDVAREAERFVAVRVNLSDPAVDATRFSDEDGVSAAPVVLFVDTAGSVRYDLRVTGGSIRPEDFLRRMREVR